MYMQCTCTAHVHVHVHVYIMYLHCIFTLSYAGCYMYMYMYMYMYFTMSSCNYRSLATVSLIYIAMVQLTINQKQEHGYCHDNHDERWNDKGPAPTFMFVVTVSPE